MHTYISVLRGINVGGQKKVNMQGLKTLYEALGLQGVVTYIQSGNVIFHSACSDTAPLKTQIEAAIETHCGFAVAVEIRRAAAFTALLDARPFAGISLDEDGTRVLLTFLSAAPAAGHIAALRDCVAAPEQLVIDDRTVYLHCPNGYGKSKLSNNFIEKKLPVVATTRNLKTVTKRCQLAGGL